MSWVARATLTLLILLIAACGDDDPAGMSPTDDITTDAASDTTGEVTAGDVSPEPDVISDVAEGDVTEDVA